MNLASNALQGGKRFRALSAMNQFARECLTIGADQSIKGEQVVGVMRELAAKRGVPERLETGVGQRVQKALDR